jgi:hypothetical protein
MSFGRGWKGEKLLSEVFRRMWLIPQIPRGGTQSFQRHVLTGQMGKIPTPLLTEGAVAVPRQGVRSLKEFLEHGRPFLQRGARRSMWRETYVAQFREPYASLGHANPLGGHNQLRHITRGGCRAARRSKALSALADVHQGEGAVHGVLLLPAKSKGPLL